MVDSIAVGLTVSFLIHGTSWNRPLFRRHRDTDWGAIADRAANKPQIDIAATAPIRWNVLVFASFWIGDRGFTFPTS